MNTCDTDEPRGSDVLLSGVCNLCGRVTTHRNTQGQAQHKQKETP